MHIHRLPLLTGPLALTLLFPCSLACNSNVEPPTSHPTFTATPILPTETPPDPDREALIALYNATDGQNRTANHNWLTDAPIDDWYGVEVDPQGHVVELILSGNQLSGEIPPELGNLAKLTRLILSGNQLNGCVPASLQGKAVSDLPHC